MGEGGEFSSVHFVDEGWEIGEPVAAIGDDGEFGLAPMNRFDGLQHILSDRPHPGNSGLIHYDQDVNLRCESLHAGDEFIFHRSRSGRAVFDIKSGKFFRGVTRMMQEGFGITERPPFFRLLKKGEINAGQSIECSSQFETFAVITMVTNGEKLGGTIGGEVGRDIAGGPGLAPHLADVINRQARFERNFGLGGINIEIAIEREIADDPHTECADVLKERVKAVGAHGSAGNRNLAWAAIALCNFVGRVHIDFSMVPTINTLPDFRSGSLRGKPGYFRVGQTEAGQWWFIDAQDRPFFAKAVHNVSADANSPHDPAARLRSWGFNALGCASERLALDEGLPFFATVNFCGVEETVNLGGVKLPDVFSKNWPRLAQERAAEVCLRLMENRELLGWITDDGPSWPLQPEVKRPGLLQVCLSVNPDKAAYHAAWEFALALYGGKLETLAKAWGVTLANKEALRAMTREERGIATVGHCRDDAQWSQEFARRYFGATTRAIRKVDENHLVLGPRWGRAISTRLRREGAAAVDVSLVDYTELNEVSAGPVMLGDFCWAQDSFYELTGSRQVLGPSKLERMLRRGRIALAQSVSHASVVGYAWRRWHDRKSEAPPFGSGLVRADESTAVEHTELLTAINDRVEELRALALAAEEPL